MLFRYLAMLMVALISQACLANDALALRDGLLIEPASGQVIIMRPGGGLESINGVDGSTAWQSDSADRPLSLSNRELLSQIDTAVSGLMNLARLALDTGTVKSYEDLTLPQQVIPLIDERLGQRFEYRPFDADQFVWRYEKRTARGMAPLDSDQEQISSGAFSVAGSRVTTSPNPTASAMSSLWQAQTPAAQNEISGVSGRQFSAINASHILVSQLDPDATQWDRYLWQIYSADGVKLGEARSPMSYSPFIVVAGQLLFVTQPYTLNTPSGELQHTPLMLRAVDLATGELNWTREIRDTRYRGPYPA